MNHEPKQVVLIVDGNPASLRSISQIVTSIGCTVIEADNEDQCLTLFQRYSPQLVILTSTLPDIAASCRQLKSLANTPILVLTQPQETLIERALEAGADDWLMEPPSPTLLRKRVQQLLATAHVNENHIRTQQLIEKTLYYIAQGAWGLSSEDFLRALMIYLGKSLNAAYVLVGEVTPDKKSIETVAMYAQGQIVSNVTYELDSTPCKNLFSNKLCYYASDIQALFPDDSMLVELNVESYIGIPLWTTSGEAFGILVVMDTKPLEQVQIAATLLQLVAVRAARELERRHHEQELLEAEQFSRSTLNGLNDHIAIVDETGIILAVNEAWRDFAAENGGMTNGVNEGANYLEACDNATHEGIEQSRAVADAIRKILKGKQTHFELEYPCHSADGERWFTVSINRFPGDGSPRVIIAHHNITSRKLVERALWESEARYQSVIQALAEGIVVQDADGEIRASNSSAERILGLTPDQMMGRTSVDPNWHAIHEDYSPFPGEEHPAMITLGAGIPQHEVVMGVYKPDGTLTWISINTEPLMRTDEIVPYAVVASFTDITARKHAEDELRLSEARYRMISELISDYAFDFRVNDEGTLETEWCTDSFQLITGYTRDIADGKDRKLYHPDDRDRVEEGVQEALAGKPNVGEYRIVTAGGEIKWVQVYRQPIFNAQGRVVRMYAVTCDISAEKNAEQALVEQKRLEAVLNKERELNAFRTNLMRTLSHELRTPLAIMTTACDLLEHYMERATPQQRQEKINNIRIQIDRLSEMLEDISIIVQSSAQHLNARWEIGDYAEICRNCVYEVHQSMGAEHRMTFEFNGQALNAHMDKRLLRRTVANLLTNAVKYSPPGSEIVTRLGCEDNSIIIEVADQGIGMSAQDQQFAFEPFYRSNAVAAIHGTGLGLSIVRECVTLMQGTVYIKSEMGSGSTFVVRLPYRN
jgi:PAS domain S-box-containing protein